MEPGFFLDLADNTGDVFSYELLPAFSFKDIPQRRNPVTLVRCVVRPRVMTSTDAPVCEKSTDGFKFYNSHGIEIFGTEEHSTPPAPLIATATNNTTINKNTVPSPIDLFSTIDKATDKTVNHNTPSTHIFTHDDDVHSILPTILEEDYPLLDEPNLCERSRVATSPVVNPSQTIDITH